MRPELHDFTIILCIFKYMSMILCSVRTETNNETTVSTKGLQIV